MGKKILLLFLLSFCCIKHSPAQGIAGKDFWAAFIDINACLTSDTPHFRSVDSTEFYISSEFAAKVNISIKKETYYSSGVEADSSRTVTLSPNQPFFVKMQTGISNKSFFSDNITNNGVHITSDSLIYVYAVNRFPVNRGAAMVIPSESIPAGPEYLVSCNENSGAADCQLTGVKKTESGGFLIVGISNVSKIEIIPKSSSHVRNNRPGIPFVITLNQGQTFLYMSPDYDLTGTIVRSRDINSKFAVFAGNRVTRSKQLNSSGVMCTGGSDHTFEQMSPTVTWGNSYTALPFKNNKGGYYLKIVAAEDFTRVSIDGSYRQTLNHGDFMLYNVAIDSATRVTADKYFSVTQFANGNFCNQHPAPKINFGDMAQITLVPDKQNLNTNAVMGPLTHYYFRVPKSHIRSPEYYINVMMKTSDTGLFSLNGNGIPNSQWKSSPVMTGFSYAFIDMDTALNYRVYNPKGLIAYTYGYAEFEAYASMASASFKPIQNQFIFDDHCLFDTVKFTAVKNDSFSNYSWNLGNSSAIKTGSSASTIYADTGWFKVVMYCSHVRTNAIDSVSKYVYVPAISKTPMLGNDTMICGKVDFPLYAANFNTDNTYLWWDGHPNYYKIIKKAGKYWVKVMERSGCSYRDTITVTNFPFPFANFTSSDTSICLNKNRSVTYTNYSSAPDSIVSNKWDFGDTILVDNNLTVKHLFKQVGKYNVSLTVRSVHGCEDDTVKTLNIAPSPVAEFKIIGLDSCFNNNRVILKNTTVIDSALHKNFKWFFSEGFFLSNENPGGPWNYALPGKYSILLVYANTYNCLDSMKNEITIYDHPKSAFNLSKTFQCTYDTVHFLNSTSSVYKPVSSLWNFGDMQSDTASRPAHFYPSKGVYSVKLVSSSPQGCKDSILQSLNIYDQPQAAFAINDSFQCLSGNRFLLANLSTTDTGNFISRLWSYDDTTFDSNTDNPAKIFNAAGQHFIKLKVVNMFGCSDSLSKTVFAKKGPDVLFKVNDPSQCFKGHNFDFNYIPVPGNGNIYGMKWYYKTDSADNISSLNNISFPSIGKYPVTLRLFDSDGCSAEAVRNVFVNPEPTAKLDTNFTAQCFNGHSFNFTQQSTILAGNISGFNWDFGDLTSSILRNPTGKTYNSSGKYNIRLIVASDSACMDTAFSFAEVYPNANINILPVTTVCLNDSSVFGANVTVSSGLITNYLWDFGDMQTAGKLNVKHRYARSGVYHITLSTTTDKNCKDSSTANNWVRVNALPVPDFRLRTQDGGDKNTIVSFTDITQPQPRSLLWDFDQFGKSVKTDTSFSISDSTTFRMRLFVTDQNGCTGIVEKYIFVSPPSKVFFPTAFSPNNDGHNDAFGPYGVLFARNYTFRVFNRWGEIMFESQNPGETWDGTFRGKVCPNGLFHYQVELYDFNSLYKHYYGMVLLMW